MEFKECAKRHVLLNWSHTYAIAFQHEKDVKSKGARGSQEKAAVIRVGGNALHNNITFTVTSNITRYMTK